MPVRCPSSGYVFLLALVKMFALYPQCLIPSIQGSAQYDPNMSPPVYSIDPVRCRLYIMNCMNYRTNLVWCLILPWAAAPLRTDPMVDSYIDSSLPLSLSLFFLPVSSLPYESHGVVSPYVDLHPVDSPSIFRAKNPIVVIGASPSRPEVQSNLSTHGKRTTITEDVIQVRSTLRTGTNKV